MTGSEAQWDRLLRIRTGGRDDSSADRYRYPYEPTPYPVLERLANSGYIKKNNTLADYGCGKGRVGFFMSYQTRCRSVGIEFDERIYAAAVRNLDTALSAPRVSFEHISAEKWDLPAECDRCFFFNPFSVEILRGVMSRIADSYYQNPRELLMCFYYPSEEYTAFLDDYPGLAPKDAIDCRDLFDGGNPRERIAVYEWK